MKNKKIRKARKKKPTGCCYVKLVYLKKKKVLKLEFLSNVTTRHIASSPQKGKYDCLKVCLITKTVKERNNPISF